MKPSPHIWIVFCVFNLSAGFICHAQSAVTNLWKLPLHSYDAESSPAIAPDGTIYQGKF